MTRFGAGSPVGRRDPRGHRAGRCRGDRAQRVGSALEAVPAAITVRGSYIVLTAPGPREARRRSAGPTASGLSDYRAALHYLRTTPDGRIAFGIGGMQPNLARNDRAALRLRRGRAPRRGRRPAPHVPLVRATSRSRPGGAARSTSSGSHLPFFGTLDGGTVHYGLGYTGNGVGPAHLGGRILRPARRSGATRTSSTCRSSTRSPCGSRPNRSARPAR